MPPARVLSFDVGTRNFAVCIVQREPFAIIHWEVIDTVAEAGVSSKGTIEDKKRALLLCLQRRSGLFRSQLRDGDAVVIEQQPFGRGQGSPTMNILAHVIGAYFLLLDANAAPGYDVRQVAARGKFNFDPRDFGGVAPAEEQHSPPVSTPAWSCTGATLHERASAQLQYSCLAQGDGHVVFRTARRAPASVAKLLQTATANVKPLSIEDVPPPREGEQVTGELPAATGKRKRAKEHARYRLNKGNSVAICASILDGSQSLAVWRAPFRESKKKDDLADAFIQALSQLH